MTKLLFVCMGNICRSPAAEGVLKKLIQINNLQDKLYCESAGTSGYHDGDPPDERMQYHANQRGYSLESYARQFDYEDFLKFDFILAMDKANMQNILRLDLEEQFKNKVVPFTQYCVQSQATEVPDPYYGGPDGFDEVLDIIEDGCKGILDHMDLLTYKF